MPKNFKQGMVFKQGMTFKRGMAIKQVAVAVLASLALPTASFAQESDLIEEIVVTATKRSQTLQEIPVAVTVTSADVIEKAQILDIADLQSVVPSLRVSQLQSSINTNFAIRGFGNGANNPGIEPSVAVFIDGVYRSRSAGAISDLPSLERVEVLNGPQSTLFGKNASAGVISVVTKKPSGEFGGKVSGSLGNFGQVILKGELEGAISDTTAYSVYAAHNSNDGYVRNLTTGNDINNRDRQSLRGQLLFNPNENTEIRIIADYDTIDEECCSSVNLVAGPTLAAIQLAGGQLVANQDDALTTFSNIDPSNEQDSAGISAQVNYDFGNYSLTSITSFRNIDSAYRIDVDFTSTGIAENEVLTDIDTFTQEFRLSSSSGDSIDWQVGAFFFDENIDYANSLPFGDGFRTYTEGLVQGAGGQAAVEQALAAGITNPAVLQQVASVGAQAASAGFAGLEAQFGPFFAEGPGVNEVATLDNQAISLFGQLDFHINDSLTATIGLNYTKDEKEATLRQINRDNFSSVDLVAVGLAQGFQSATGLTPTPQNIGAFAQANPQGFAALQAAAANPNINTALALTPLQFLPPLVDFPNAVENGETDDDDLTYTFRLAYDVNDKVNVYGGISTGFKASSFNLSRDARPFLSDLPAIQAAGLSQPNLSQGTRFAGPEEATVLEVGLKARFERGSLNLAIFDQKIEGFQSNAFAGTGFNLVNAGEQSTKGLEFDLVYYPIDALQLTLGGTFLDPIYDSFTGAEGPDGPEDLSGRTPAGINEVSLSASGTYRFNIGNNEAYVRADYFYEDDVQVIDTVLASIASRETKNLNLAAGIALESGLEFALYVRNATDHDTLISSFPSVAQDGSFSAYRTAPRTYGVTITKKF